MNPKIQIWLYIIGAVLIALAANSLSAVWASKENKLTPWFLAMVIVSPFVFITFGLVASKIGLARGAATMDSLLAVSTILVGLFVFHERSSLSLAQYFGMGFAVIGIVLMQIDA